MGFSSIIQNLLPSSGRIERHHFDDTNGLAIYNFTDPAGGFDGTEETGQRADATVLNGPLVADYNHLGVQTLCKLNGTNQSVGIDDAVFDDTGDFAFGLWMKFNSIPGSDVTLISKGTATDADKSWDVYYSSSDERIVIRHFYNAAGANNSAVTALVSHRDVRFEAGKWFFIGGVYNQTDQNFKIHYNGTEVRTSTDSNYATRNNSSVGDLIIGSSFVPSQYSPISIGSFFYKQEAIGNNDMKKVYLASAGGGLRPALRQILGNDYEGQFETYINALLEKRYEVWHGNGDITTPDGANRVAQFASVRNIIGNGHISHSTSGTEGSGDEYTINTSGIYFGHFAASYDGDNRNIAWVNQNHTGEISPNGPIDFLNRTILAIGATERIGDVSDDEYVSATFLTWLPAGEKIRPKVGSSVEANSPVTHLTIARIA